jgi:hypothetical protein
MAESQNDPIKPKAKSIFWRALILIVALLLPAVLLFLAIGHALVDR